MNRRVYISYTSDLMNYALAVKDAISNIGLQAIIFDDHAKWFRNSSMAGMHDLLRSCHFFIGIYGHRYGSVPDEDHTGQANTNRYSYIRWEYEWATQYDLDIIPLIMRAEDVMQREPHLHLFIEDLMNSRFCGFFGAKDSQHIYYLTIEFLASRLVPPQNSMVIQPSFGLPDQAEQYQTDIFMVMPFREALDAIYRDDIRPVAEEIGQVIKRGDDFQSPVGQVMAEVWHAICASKVVIADCTIPEGEGTNGNVYYELGLADTLGRPIVFITQTMPEKLPFDIRHRRLIVYDTTETGRRNLRVQLKSALITIFSELGTPILIPSQDDDR